VYRSGDVHGVNKAQPLFDAAFCNHILNHAGNVYVITFCPGIEGKVFSH